MDNRMNENRDRARRGRDTGRPGDRREREVAEPSEWQEKVIQIRRVTKVVKGGKKMSFRAIVAVGNQKGQVGIGVGKANEVISAIQKAIADAKKELVTVPMVGSTIPHMIVGASDASRVMIKPASKGTGVIAGGAVRSVLELAGIHDILSKNLGASSPLNSARATIDGLRRLRSAAEVAADRGKTVEELLGKVKHA
ncbi:MAG: 30S ribosomal protein S5 [Candidatus Sericytochromatia bacterium]|nr:30S ribosomal protein S5 [Candidatus Sericytochromatia bacterium]